MGDDKLVALKRKIEQLTPSARLLMASQLVGKGDYAAVDLGITIAETVVNEWKAANLAAKSLSHDR